MNQMKEKFRIFVWPYLIVALAYLLVYTALHWLLFIKLDLFELDEDLLKFWLPIALAWLPVLFWLRPSLRKLESNNPERSEFILQIILWLGLALPVIFAQHYMISATGKLSAVHHPTAISQQSGTRYYTLQQYYVDKNNAGIVNDAQITGRYNEKYTMSLYVVLPVLDQASDTTGKTCNTWYALYFSKTVSNDLSAAEKEKAYRQFLHESQNEFDTLSLNNFTYLEKVPYGDSRSAYLQAVQDNKRFSAAKPVILQPRFTPFEAHTVSPIWTILVFIACFVIWVAIVVYSRLRNPHEKLFNFHEAFQRVHPDHPAHAARTEDTHPRPVPPPRPKYSLLKPHTGYKVTPILMYINVAIYLLMVLKGMGVMEFRAEDLLKWGANYRPYTVNGEWWRLLTSTFLHGGLIHLASNMFGLVIAGAFLEPMIGSRRLLISYLIAGIVASGASTLWHPDTVSVGASGAIFGLFGICIPFLAKAYHNEMARRQLFNILFLVGYNLVWGMSGGVDNAAHIGGLVAGLVTGLIIHPAVKKEYLAAHNKEIPEEETLD
ncbi:MAG: rhomboid family intramembrane serine protease [Chitinophaga sp.]|uniref:rhomboid family intramembrane serine protease n=1 Tax=Chitinophaga sp. TaxID=1869181 RepID=UPI0025B8691A|nr:rhomboid family intramembrane serine protease [Chitinophaga sp.]MBV8255590.1 rhomboid family intramembrane serine protease [Chitinophaga sp.]